MSPPAASEMAGENDKQWWITVMDNLVKLAKWIALFLCVWASISYGFMLFSSYDEHNLQPLVLTLSRSGKGKQMLLVDPSILITASAFPQPQVLKFILDSAEKGKNKNIVDVQNGEGWSPLHFASNNGHFENVLVLLDYGASVNLASVSGQTALHFATSQTELAKILVKYGARVNAKDKGGATPLHRAASMGNLELCKFLVEHGALYDLKDKYALTPLLKAVIFGQEEVARYLIKMGADWNPLVKPDPDQDNKSILDRVPRDFKAIIANAIRDAGGVFDPHDNLFFGSFSAA